MVNKCVAAGCSNTSSSSITLFKFPKDPKLRYEWEKGISISVHRGFACDPLRIGRNLVGR